MKLLHMIYLETTIWYFFAVESLILKFIFKCDKISYNSYPSEIYPFDS